MTKEVLESDVGGSCQEIKLKSEESSNVQEVTEERWLVYTEPVQLESEAVTELKLAFRLDKPAGVEQAYAWLPLRSYGLRFLIQADWRVPSSREAITEAVFNQRIRDQVPNAYAEAAKIFAAAALKAAGLDAPNESGTAWNQLEAGIEAARNVLVPLYTSIPRPGDATDFFQETDVKILRAVMDVAVILVRVPCPGVKESGSEGGSEDVHDQETAWRLELVTPRRAVRAELPEGVPASLSHLQQSIELLLAQADRYVEVGGMPARAAEGLRVPVLDADIALDCLQAMGRLHMQKVANDQLNALTDEDIEVLQLLLLIVAVAALKKPQLADDVRYLQIIPTEGGELVSLTAEEARGFKVYDVPPDMLGIEALLGAGQRLDPRLTQTARPEVREFLLGLGVEQVDGLAFFTNVLLPVLTSSEAPEAEKLLLATRQFKDLLAICEDQEKKDSLIETLRASDAGWWVLASVGTSDCEAVQVGGKTGRGLHVSPLPGKLADQVGVDWLAPASTYKNSEESEESEADWNAFWMLLGAAPVFQVQERQGDFHSDELERLLAAASTPDLAMEVVEVLEPHGEYYAQWLFKPDSQDEPSEIAQLLCTKPWLPTQGGEVVPMNLAWLPPEKPKSVEARFHFDACVSPFAQAWPALGVESSPSAATLIAIVECLRSKDKLRLKIPEMASLYSRMGSPGRQDPSGNQGGGSGGTLFNKIFGQKNLDRFIEEEQWVFIPNHPRPHRDFTGWFHSCPKMEHTGKFYGLKQLVFCDKAECLDGFAARAKDAMIDLMRQCLDKRVVANYYFGPKTLWPASWRDKGIKSNLHELLSRYNKSNLHELLSRYNIQEELDVSDYVRVYKAIDQRIEKGETSEVLDFIGQTFTRIALRVKNEIEEELHRQEGTEDQDESEEELTVEKSESLEMIRKELSDVRFIQAADESWQPLKKYQFIVSRKGAEKARIKGWPSDARRFFARPPRGVNPAANHSIVELMKRLGMRESPTLLKRASFVPLQGAGNFDSVRKELVEATRVIRDGMSERLKDEDRALFEEIETVVRELQIEEVQQLSVDQVLVIEKDRAAEAEIDTLDADEGVPRWLLEFKPTSGRATPIARIKALPAEVFFIGQEDRKLVLTFQGQLVMKDVSENLSKAVIWTSLQKLAPEYQTEFQQSKTGLTDKARTFMKHLRVAIETTRASRGSAASEFLELSHEESAGESQEDQSPALKADQSEDDPGLDMENMEKFLMLQEEFKDMKDEDYYASWGGGLEETADLDEVDSPAVEDLLEHAENALNYKRKRRTSKKELDQEKPGSSPKVPPSAPPDASGAGTSDASDVLSPNLPYDVAAEPLSGDGASRRGAGGGGSSNTEGSSDAKQAVGKRDEDTWTESGTRDFRDARAPRKNLQQEEEVEDSETVSRIVQAQRQQIASPRPYSFTRLARFCAAPVTTGQSSSFDITFTMRDFTPISTGGGESNAQVVGRNGEKIAQLSLESEGYQVLWLNEKEELGLPFDLLIRKTGDFSSLLVNGAVDKSQVEELASKVEEGQVEEFTFVEVKSTTKGDKGVERSIFDVSINEVVSMNNLGEHFWLLRTLRVPTGLEDGTETKVRIWPNAAKAVRDGEVKLLMVG